MCGGVRPNSGRRRIVSIACKNESDSFHACSTTRRCRKTVTGIVSYLAFAWLSRNNRPSISRLLHTYPSNSCLERGRIVCIACKNNVNVNIMTSMSRLLRAYSSNSCLERGRIVSIACKTNVSVNIVTSMSRLLHAYPNNSCLERGRIVSIACQTMSMLTS